MSGSDNTTANVKERFVFTNDIVALLLIASIIVFIFYGITDFPMVYKVAVGLAAVWTFGRQSVKMLRYIKV